MTEIQTLIRQGKFDEAAELAKREYERTKNEKILNLYGIALFKKGDYKNSSEVFEKLYIKHPESPKLLINYASSLIEMGELEKAEKLLRENAMLFPEEPKIYELIDDCQRRKAKKTEEGQEGKESKTKDLERKDLEPKELRDEMRETGAEMVETGLEELEAGKLEEGKTGESLEQRPEREPEREMELSKRYQEEGEVRGTDDLEEMIEDIEEIKSEWIGKAGEKVGEEGEAKVGEEGEAKVEEEGKEKEAYEMQALVQAKQTVQQDDDMISLVDVQRQDTFLRRGRFLEIELKKDDEIILRETFIVLISGIFKVFPLTLREGGRNKGEFFGGKNHKFVKIRGGDCVVSAEGEFLSVATVEEKLVIFEHYLAGFTPSLSYDTRKVKIKKFGKIRLVELKGSGKVIIFTAGKKIMMKEANGYTKVSLPTFIGATGEPKINVGQDSVDIEGAEHIIIRM